MIENVLWLITARSGSKSIKDKNIKLLGDYPLFYYKYHSVKKITPNENIWASTDSKKYAEIFNKFGLNTPFIRPSKLSEDDSSSEDVIIHAMDYAESINKEKEYICLLEPTSPFIYENQLTEALKILQDNANSKSLVSTVESRPNSIFVQNENKYLDKISDSIRLLKKTGRQNFKKQITPSGGFYFCEWKKFKESKTFYNENTISYQLNDISGLEIDEPIDWEFAEFIVKKKLYEIK